MGEEQRHYLEAELYRRIAADEEIFDFIQSGSLDGLWYWDLESPDNEWMNAKFWQLLGYDPAEKAHKASEWQALIHPDDLKTMTENFHAHLADPSHPYDQVVRYRHRDGSTVWVRCRGIAIRDANGKPTRMLGAHNDLTELKQTELKLREQAQDMLALQKELRQLASHDDLTGLANRRAFRERLNWQLGNSRRRGEAVSLVSIDLDRFKEINDELGHPEGDRVLRLVAATLAGTVRESDLLARVGGEEFVVVLSGAGRSGAVIAAERFRAMVAELSYKGRTITASCGVATASGESMEGDLEACGASLIERSDRALYMAKRKGRNCVVHVDAPSTGALARAFKPGDNESRV